MRPISAAMQNIKDEVKVHREIMKDHGFTTQFYHTTKPIGVQSTTSLKSKQLGQNSSSKNFGSISTALTRPNSGMLTRPQSAINLLNGGGSFKMQLSKRI